MADDFTTHAGSVLDTLAVTRGDIPALPAGGCSLFSATGYATGGGGVPARASVPPDAKWANSIKCEIGNVVKLGTVGGVVTLVPGDNGQMADVLVGAPGIYSASGATAAISNVNTRVVIGSIVSTTSWALSGVYSSQACTAAGYGSACLAASTCVASGDISLVSASNTCTASETASMCLSSLNSSATAASATVIAASYAKASGSRSLIAASEGQAADDIEVSGDDCAAVASYGSTAQPTLVAGARNASIGTVGGTWNATSAECVSVACNTPTFNASSICCADLGSAGSDYKDHIVHGGSLGCIDANIDHNFAVALGSNSPGPSPSPACIYGGQGGTMTWNVNSETGNPTFLGTTIKFGTIPSGATAVIAGAATGELWRDSTDNYAIHQA